MARAVVLAARGLGRTFPNPVVGCVVLDAAGDIVGEGWHAAAGGDHAEVHALAEAGPRAAGGTAVVTLEPCAHQGRTGPCTRALVDAGIARVVFAVADPTSDAGGGARTLQDSGIEVEGGVEVEAGERVNRAWLTSVRQGRPFVTVKTAASLDGRVAAADGSSRWITGSAARADAHRLRAHSDAVLVGTGTLLRDDPALTVRDVEADLRDRQPLRVVMGHRPIPSGARILDGGGEVLAVATHDPRELLAVLHARGMRSLLVEGGPTVTSAFLAAGVVDEVVAYVAPLVIGEGPAAVSGLAGGSIADALRLRDVEIEVLADDVRISGRPVRGEDAA
jgi:diaminohydroxyphosphoribosylaminopyrimidine deaminase / 5-amino-6-(5-phosphoribosylamino)uracil reductase